MCVDTEKRWLNRGREKNVEYLWKVSGRYAFHAKLPDTAWKLPGNCLDDLADVGLALNKLRLGPSPLERRQKKPDQHRDDADDD